MKKPKMSLAEYAKTHPSRGKCMVCVSPFREDIEAAHASGVPIPVIWRWLRDECGVEINSDGPIRHHFNRGRHHAQKA